MEVVVLLLLRYQFPRICSEDFERTILLCNLTQISLWVESSYSTICRTCWMEQSNAKSLFQNAVLVKQLRTPRFLVVGRTCIHIRKYLHIYAQCTLASVSTSIHICMQKKKQNFMKYLLKSIISFLVIVPMTESIQFQHIWISTHTI